MNRDELPHMLAAGGIVLCQTALDRKVTGPSGRGPRFGRSAIAPLEGGYALLIRKHGKWDIPKGKLKEYEPLEQCAIREIAEETGLHPRTLSIRGLLCRSSYISRYSGLPFNKVVSWFLLDYSGSPDDLLTPDLTEDIDLCQWVPVADLVETLQAGRSYLAPLRRSIEQFLSAPSESNTVAVP